jgi:photosystem II stability/assembly factor-like uncharacterized protein
MPSIYYTTDGGQNWQLQLADTTIRYDILFVDSLLGWACGDAATLMNTLDGGNTWHRQAEGIIEWGPVYGVQFLDNQKGWAVGGLNWGVFTTDGGMTWERDTSLARVPKIIYSDCLHLWGISELREHIWRSSDGGLTWDYPTIIDTTVQFHIKDISALDNDILFVATDLGIYKSINGGDNWYLHSPQKISGFQFLDSVEVWGTGSTDYAELLHSTDGGITWTDIVSVNNPSPYGVYEAVDFMDSQTGWIVGNSFTQGLKNFILNTSDGGQTWVEQYSTVLPQLKNLCFVDSDYGWAIGEDGIILHTTDSGVSWNVQPSGSNLDLGAISFVNRNKGWIVGGGFTNNGLEGIILHTFNGGRS